LISLIIIYKFIGSGYKMHYLPPLSWKELLDYLPTIGFEAFAISLVIIVVSKIWTKKTKSYKNPVVCDSCNIIKEFDNVNQCLCGGKYISMDEMKWVDDDK